MAEKQAVGSINSREGETLKYTYPPETKADLDYADLVALDLSLFDSPRGVERLADQLKNAVENTGFFYITNFGLSQAEIDHQFAIAKEVFDLPLSEKLKYEANLEMDGYVGYRPSGNRELVPGVFDNIEVYGFDQFNSYRRRRELPPVVEQNLSSIEKVSRHLHIEVGGKLLRLISIVLGLPEDYFLSRHRYDHKGGCNLRYLKYGARSAEEVEKLGETPSVRGHTDFGTLTFLLRQPVAGLQVNTPDGQWKYVKAHPASITVNVADMMDFVTGGYLRSSVHRVLSPPADQARLDRIGVVYFLRYEDDVALRRVDSPILKDWGSRSRLGEASGITAGEWVKARTSDNAKMTAIYLNHEPQVAGGIKVKNYA